jgi:hypothetical protein
MYILASSRNRISRVFLSLELRTAQRSDHDREGAIRHPALALFSRGRLFDIICRRLDGHKHTATSLLCEADVAINQREDRVIRANANILAGVEFGSTLANDDVARYDQLAAKFLDTETPASGVATVP